MTDILERLRGWWVPYGGKNAAMTGAEENTDNLIQEAADEIERLRAELDSEREACAKVAKDYAETRTGGWPGLDQDEVCHAISADIAAAICSRNGGEG